MAGPTEMELGEDFEREYPGASALATELYYNVVRTAHHLVVLMAELQRHFGLSEPEANILSILEGARQPLTPGVIRDRMLQPVSSGAVTGILDGLERKGYVARSRHPTDRRSVLVAITDSGLALLRQFRPPVHELQREVAACLSSAEQEQLLRSLLRLQERAAQARNRDRHHRYPSER